MLTFFKGLRLTFATVILFSLCTAGAIYFTSIWLPWQENLLTAAIALSAGVFIFAIQFNQTRFAYLSALFLFFMVSKNYPTLWSSWLEIHHVWLFISGLFTFSFLTFSKDRGLFSVHFFTRLICFFLCGLLAYGWLFLSEFVLVKWLPSYLSFLPSIQWWIPSGIVFVLVLWRSLRVRQLINAALFISCAVWLLQFNQQLPLGWVPTLCLLMIFYVGCLILDSYYLAYRDELTGLPTRRALTNLSLSLSRKYTVAMVDIDHFKKFNDTYGHDIGDQVLKLVAAKLSKVKRGGKIFRYGGEEFTVVFPGKQSDQVKGELERLRVLIADYQMLIREEPRQTKKDRKPQPGKEKTVKVTVSIGVASRTGKLSFDETLKKADLALYQAKKAGRNKVMLYLNAAK